MLLKQQTLKQMCSSSTEADVLIKLEIVKLEAGGGEEGLRMCRACASGILCGGKQLPKHRKSSVVGLLSSLQYGKHSKQR